MITAGSYSRLNIFESCPLRAKLAFIEKIREPERPPLANGKEYANDRGQRIHDSAEGYVRGLPKYKHMIPELVSFSENVEILRAIFSDSPKRIVMENVWKFNNAWKCLPADIDNRDKRIWLRIILDALVFSTCGTKALVIDYKSGRRFGNEVKHAQQTQLYALAVALRYPDIEHITTELWYTDQDEIATKAYRANQIKVFFRNWNERMIRMTTCTVFNAKPSSYTCTFCPYKTGRMGKHGMDGLGLCDRNPT